MDTVTPDFVSELIDFAPADAGLPAALGKTQLEGTVALFNMLARNRCAYLADEVGTGKTYIALGVIGLLRYLNPKARIIVIAPRESIQLKWEKELRNFVRVNWRHPDNRVKSLQGEPVWKPAICANLVELAREALLQPDRDFLLRMPSFSLAVNAENSRKRARRLLRREIPWLPSNALRPEVPERFRDAVGCALNLAVPETDLVIVDEAHNLKHGYGERVSIRNRIMGLAFGHPSTEPPQDLPYRHGLARRVLLLSATPFEDDYDALRRQLNVFGFGSAKLREADSTGAKSVARLAHLDPSHDDTKAIVRRLMIRRVSGLEVGGQLLTKNMYRREWRRGGVEVHDEPMAIEDPKQRLVVALMQKKVAEVLQSERFNNSFQIGMLSSFESFLESVQTAQRHQKNNKTRRGNGQLTDESTERTFDGDQTDDEHERHGIDSQAIAEMLESYRQAFGEGLPHPKLDATAGSLESAFHTAEKSLVFVRRVRTVEELAARVDTFFDRWLRERMERTLPDLKSEIASLFERYAQERRRRPDEQPEASPVHTDEQDTEDSLEARSYVDEGDEGSAETFFAWFFRGQGPHGYLSGAAFQRNRLGSASSAYATLFEDDLVAALLGRPADVIDALAEAVAANRAGLVQHLRERAYAHFRARTQRTDSYPRLYVFEGYQVAALELLDGLGGALGERARIVLQERYPGDSPATETAPEGFPAPEEALGLTTFVTELAGRPALRACLWPDEPSPDFRAQFRRSEQRRELVSAMARLGVAYIDLYLVAVRTLGSFDPKREGERARPVEALARDFADLLERQSHEPGLHAFHELASAAGSLDLLLAVNFPGVPNARLSELARIYSDTLQRQVPVGRMSGGVNKRLVRQFRMPGFPLVLITTDVLQEGEDLHTFCRNVIHYGITWTASAMEQRTGRVDRIGSLVQRRLQAHSGVPDTEEYIQVYYPHLRDTVEVLQVRRVLKRLNRFFELIHVTGHRSENEYSRIDTARDMLDDLAEIEPFTEPLQSAFPIAAPWLAGELDAANAGIIDFAAHDAHFDDLWKQLLERLPIDPARVAAERSRGGGLEIGDNIRGDRVTQHFRLKLRSQTAGKATLLRCASTARKAGLSDDETLDRIDALTRDCGGAKVCVHPDDRDRLHDIEIESDLFFDPRHTQIEELEALVLRTTRAAAKVRLSLAELEPSLSSRLREGLPPNDELLHRIDQLIVTRKLPWARRGRQVVVDLAHGDRRQRIDLARRGDVYIFSSTIVRRADLPRTLAFRDVVYRAWRRNMASELVAFTFNDEDTLIGVLEQPAATLDRAELEIYVQALAAECDRFEYAVRGLDEA